MTSEASLTRQQSGVSLIEVLAALAILAMMTLGVVAVLRPADQLENRAAEQLMLSFREARELALISGDVIGFASDRDGRGYGFYVYVNRSWRRLDNRPALQPVRFATPGLVIEMAAGAIESRGATNGSPQIWFDPTGFDTPFRYVLRTSEGVAWVSRNAEGQVQLDTEPAGAL